MANVQVFIFQGDTKVLHRQKRSPNTADNNPTKSEVKPIEENSNDVAIPNANNDLQCEQELRLCMMIFPIDKV